jgi:hypothetical protein
MRDEGDWRAARGSILAALFPFDAKDRGRVPDGRLGRRAV